MTTIIAETELSPIRKADEKSLRQAACSLQEVKPDDAAGVGLILPTSVIFAANKADDADGVGTPSFDERHQASPTVTPFSPS